MTIKNEFIKNNLLDANATLEKFCSSTENMKMTADAIHALADCYKRGNKAISCGNGGSMCDAMHFAEELTGRFCQNRPALPALAISDSSHITCVANDFGYDSIFSRSIEAWGKAGDILVAISTSGNSSNIIAAALAAKDKGMKVIGLLGKDGGKLKSIVDFPIVVPHSRSDRIQEIHIKIIHTMIEGIERELFPHLYT